MHRQFQLIVGILAVLSLLALASSSSLSASPSSNPTGGKVKHNVFFRFKDGVPQETRDEVMIRFLKLKYLCVNPKTNQTYIESLDGGYANSHEGADQNMTQGFVVTFSSVADRDYYVGRPYTFPYDPHHDAFKQFVGPLLDTKGVFVFDFTVL